MNNSLKVKYEGSVEVVYTCCDCQKKELGTPVRVSGVIESYKQDFPKLLPCPSGMPIGWASYRKNVYRCRNCVK